MQMGSVAHPASEGEAPRRAAPPLSVASGSQGDPDRRRAKENVTLTTEALAADGEDSLRHLRRRVAASIARSACPASSPTAFGGCEEQEELRKRMDEYLLHEECYKSVTGEDGEEPIAAHGSRPQTNLGSYPYSGPSSDIAETASLPRRPRPEYPRAWPRTSRAPEMSPGPPHPEPSHGALDRTAELLAKLLSGSEDPDVTALSEAVKAKLGISEYLPQASVILPLPRTEYPGR